MTVGFVHTSTPNGRANSTEKHLSSSVVAMPLTMEGRKAANFWKWKEAKFILPTGKVLSFLYWRFFPNQPFSYLDNQGSCHPHIC